MNCLHCDIPLPAEEFLCVKCWRNIGMEPVSLFKNLTEKEEKEYRQYALENDPTDLAEWEIYHPICREVWTQRGIHP